MLISLIRTLILYFAIIVVFRCMGKRQIGELQPSELILAIMVSDIATVPMESTGKPLLSGIIPIIALMTAEIILSYVSQKSEKVRKLLTGSASLIISNGKIDIKELKRLRINIDDLSEELRMNGYSTVAEIEHAILETNGEISIIPKSNVRPLNADDIGVPVKKASLHKNIIKDGKIEQMSLKEIGRDENWLRKIVSDEKTSVNKVFLMTSDGETYFIQNKEKK